LQALVKRAVGEPYVPLVQSLDSIEGDLDAECNQFVNRIVSMFGNEAGEYFRGQLESLVQEDLRSRSVEIMLGRVLMSLEHHAEAVALLTQTASRYPGEKWIYYYLATSYQELERPAEAEAALRKSLEYDPTDPDVLNFLGYLLADENIKLAESERLILNALQLDPENGFYLDSLGWVYYRQGKAKQAVDNIRRAIRAMNSDDAILRDHLGDAYLLDKDYASAVREWQRALRLDPKIEGVQEKIDRYQGRIKKK
jgi:tetratricopeptide (TPR) repeat protein